jgi:radical SAM-linked protein
MEQLLWFKYHVCEPLNWVGHLSIMREFERAWRRTELPLTYSQGYNPRIRQSFGLPLVVGATSECEYGEIRFNQWVNVSAVEEKLAACVNPHIKIVKVILAPTLGSSLMQILRYSDYRFKVAADSADILSGAIDRFQKTPEIWMLKKTKHQERQVDIKAWVQRLSILDAYSFEARLCSGEGGNLKPLELLACLDPALSPVRLHRLASLDDQQKILF